MPYRLSNWVEILEHPKYGFGWRFQGGPDRPDKDFYISRILAIKAAILGLKQRSNTDIIEDEPPTTIIGQSKIDFVQRGLKSRRNDTHGRIS